MHPSRSNWVPHYGDKSCKSHLLHSIATSSSVNLTSLFHHQNDYTLSNYHWIQEREEEHRRRRGNENKLGNEGGWRQELLVMIEKRSGMKGWKERMGGRICGKAIELKGVCWKTKRKFDWFQWNTSSRMRLKGNNWRHEIQVKIWSKSRFWRLRFKNYYYNWFFGRLPNKGAPVHWTFWVVFLPIRLWTIVSSKEGGFVFCRTTT